MEVVNYLLGYEGLNIVQNTEMFHFSLDSVLLPNFITLSKNAKEILDIGCGNAPIPLILSTKTPAHITGIEIQKEVANLANKSVELNLLKNQITIINEDINNFATQELTEKYDIITCNPPFFKVKNTSNTNLSDYKTIARHEVALTLEQLLSISRKLLKNGGVLGIVHRPERLVDILTTMRENNIEPKKIRFVYPRKNSDANILLIEGKKNGQPGLKLLPPLYTHNTDGTYTEEVKKYFEKSDENVSEEL